MEGHGWIVVLREDFLGMPKHGLLVKSMACPQARRSAVNISPGGGKALPTPETLLAEANSARDV